MHKNHVFNTSKNSIHTHCKYYIILHYNFFQTEKCKIKKYKQNIRNDIIQTYSFLKNNNADAH